MVVAMAAEPLGVPPLRVIRAVMVGMVVPLEAAEVRQAQAPAQAPMGQAVTARQAQSESLVGR